MGIVRIKGVDFNTDDLVGLHTGKFDQDFLNLGRIIVSPPGIREAVRGDLGLSTDPRCEIEIFYRHGDNLGEELDATMSAGLQSLRWRFVALGGNIKDLERKYYKLFGRAY